MELDDYQERAWKTAVYPFAGSNPVYPTLGLCGESGEVAEKVKKMIRDGKTMGDIRDDVAKELGDVLWYVSALAKEFGFSLDWIASVNLLKLANRADRGKLKGSGDNR